MYRALSLKTSVLFMPGPGTLILRPGNGGLWVTRVTAMIHFRNAFSPKKNLQSLLMGKESVKTVIIRAARRLYFKCTFSIVLRI